LVITAELANLVAGYYNGIVAGHHWNGVAVGDRLLLAASYVLVGYMSIKTQEFAREAGVSMGRMRQIDVEKALRVAIGRVRETLNVELVQRAVARESVALLSAFKSILILRETPFGTPLIFSYAAGDRDISAQRRPLSTELASLAARAAEADDVVCVTPNDVLGRLTLDALGASEALVASISVSGSPEYVLVACADAAKPFVSDAPATLRAFARQAGMALEQAGLFRQLGERNDEIARQKDELADRGDVIRDIVYALAHDLRTPLSAAHVTMNQALAGAYGELPERYRVILRTSLGANDDQRRIVETLLLVARYEAGETSTIRERVCCDQLVERIVAELAPVAEIKGVEMQALSAEPLPTMGDPHEVRRAITNLLANAIDATPRGGHVTVRGNRSGEWIEIAVEDDGYGVPQERREGLFARFGGGHAGAGTGLGLYIVRRIAEKYGGSVRYVPRSPRGSTFTMKLPMLEG
jgi:signal transduction histidine kinase